MSEFKGQCMCGALRFVAAAPSLWCAHCHRRFCRQAHGAAFVTWVAFPQASVRIIAAGALLGVNRGRSGAPARGTRRGATVRSLPRSARPSRGRQ